MYYFSVLQIKTFQVEELRDIHDEEKWQNPSNVLTDATRTETPEAAVAHSYLMKSEIYGNLDAQMQQKLMKAALGG